MSCKPGDLVGIPFPYIGIMEVLTIRPSILSKREFAPTLGVNDIRHFSAL